MSGKKKKMRSSQTTRTSHISDNALKSSFFRERKSVSNNDYLDTTPKTRPANPLLRLLEKPIKVSSSSSSPLDNLKTRDVTPRLKSEVCKERAERREVLFAKGFAGKGKVKKAKWTQDSKVRC